MDLTRLGFPCPTPTCPHAGECFEATRRRAEGGHACAILAAPKMDTPDLVAAACSCGRYRSGSTSEREARKAWRAHADAKMGWVVPKRPHLPGRRAGEHPGPPMSGPPEGPVMTEGGWGPADIAGWTYREGRPLEPEIRVSTRPQDWAQPARDLLWPGLAGSRDRLR